MQISKIVTAYQYSVAHSVYAALHLAIKNVGYGSFRPYPILSKNISLAL